MDIAIINEFGEIDILNKCIEQFIQLLLEKEGVSEDSEVSILFTDDEDIKRLNKKYRNIDKSTNVLSFSMKEGIPVPFDNILGDIAVSIEYAKREAEEMGLSLEDRIVQLLIHGILHLLGYDHIEDEDYEKMFSKEEFYFRLWKEEKEKCDEKV